MSEEIPPKRPSRWTRPLTVPSTESVADQARKKLTVEIPETLYEAIEPYRDQKVIRVADVVQQALVAALSDAQQPQKAAIVRRLSLERDIRHGYHYQNGVMAGLSWAKDTASWKEIQGYAWRPPDTVQIDQSLESGQQRFRFGGPFQAPDDYPGAPNIPGLNLGAASLEAFWTGWLDGVWKLYLYVANQMGMSDEQMLNDDEYEPDANRALPTVQDLVDARREVAEWLRSEQSRSGSMSYLQQAQEAAQVLTRIAAERKERGAEIRDIIDVVASALNELEERDAN